MSTCNHRPAVSGATSLEQAALALMHARTLLDEMDDSLSPGACHAIAHLVSSGRDLINTRPTQAPARHTRPAVFFPCASEQAALFTVAGGVDSDDALSQASGFLQIAHDMLATARAETSTVAFFGARYLVGFAAAVVDACLVRPALEVRHG